MISILPVPTARIGNEYILRGIFGLERQRADDVGDAESCGDERAACHLDVRFKVSIY